MFFELIDASVTSLPFFPCLWRFFRTASTFSDLSLVKLSQSIRKQLKILFSLYSINNHLSHNLSGIRGETFWTRVWSHRKNAPHRKLIHALAVLYKQEGYQGWGRHYAGVSTTYSAGKITSSNLKICKVFSYNTILENFVISFIRLCMISEAI